MHTQTIPYFRVLVFDMDDALLSDTAYPTYDAAVAAEAMAKADDMVPPGGRTKVEEWGTVFRLTDNGWERFHETLTP